MAHCDPCNVQFLDLTGVDEDEKKWILTSLQIRDSKVKGPWSKPEYTATPTAQHIQKECHSQHVDVTTNNNVLPPRSFDHYQPQPPANIIIPNHVSPIPAGFPPHPFPVYSPPFVPPYQPPIVAVNAPIALPPFATPVVTYPNYAAVPVVPNNYGKPQPQPIPMVVQELPATHSQQPSLSQPPIILQPLPLSQPLSVSQGTTFSQAPTLTQAPMFTQAPMLTQTPLQPPMHSQPQAASPQPPVLTQSPLLSQPSLQPHQEIVDESTATVNGFKNEDDVAKSNGEATKSWASLFSSKGTGNNGAGAGNEEVNKSLAKVPPFAQTSNSNVSPDVASKKKKSILADYEDPNYYRMGEILVNYSVDHKISSLQPRGLINRSNYCYINSILQAILACPPVYNLLRSLGQEVAPKDGRKHTQIIDNMVKFVNEFNPLPEGQRVNRRSDNKLQKKEPPITVNCDKPFEPNWIYKMLNGIRSDSFVVEGRQEDAEEFLGCLLNGLNDEMLELMKLVGDESASSNDGSQQNQQQVVQRQDECDNDKNLDGEKEWQVIGPKNKGFVTRRTEVVKTPISDIFGGNIRSRLFRAGDHDQITDNIQPFFTLQLNIEKVNTVREALEALVCKNQLEGVTSSKTNEEVEAWQQVTIEELPIVMVLHLKCFDFKLDGCTKIVKALEFPVDLKIDTKLLSSKQNYQAKEKQYKLFAVVYHDGKEATKGHYVTDAYHIGYASWIRYDDTSVKAVKEEDVLKPHGTRVPYLLFYRRSDTVRGK